jgi:hypothetical protein
MSDKWFATSPHLIRGLAPVPLELVLLSKYTAQLTASPPKHARQLLGFHHTPSCSQNSLVPSFQYTILLRSIRCSQFPPNAKLCTVLTELLGREFSSSISAKCTHQISTFPLSSYLHSLDGHSSFILPG